MGVSVTQRISKISQPRGGYLKPKDFERIELTNNNALYTEENIHSSLVGLAVDYLTRFMLDKDVEKAFAISLLGASLGDFGNIAEKFLTKIKGLDDQSIICACKLVGFDVIYRAGFMGYKPVDEINPDEKTVFNIREMVSRSLAFFEKYGPIMIDGFTFEGGYSSTVSAGDGDFLTEDTLWDFKVSTKEPTNKHTLQLLIYYIMGLHSKHKYFQNIKKIAIYNPRLNVVYIKSLDEISIDIIKEIEEKVICY